MVLALTLWLACMGILTWCVASDMLIQVEEQLNDYVRHFGSRGTKKDDELPGTLEARMIDSLRYPYATIHPESLLPGVYSPWLQNSVSSNDWLWDRWDLNHGYEAAVIYFDENREYWIGTGDYLQFEYTTSERWADHNTEVMGKGYVALDELPGGEAFADSLITESPYGSGSIDMLCPVICMTGYFEGNEFHPTVIDRGLYNPMWSDPRPDIDKVCLEGVEWSNMLTLPPAADVEQQTIYVWNMSGYNTTPRPVTLNGVRYSSLTELLRQSNGNDWTDKYNLLESVLVAQLTRKDDYGSYTHVVAIRCKPLQYAALRLIWVYVISCAICAVWVAVLIRRFKKHLAEPMNHMRHALKSGMPIRADAACEEMFDLQTEVSVAQLTLAQNRNELQQLRTALDYAHDAEEKRKQLISNITHELKTPLAVIHSYAESLQEDSINSQQKQYLDTILEETERMDAMVVQMLDLSRLDSGRTRLSADQFSLASLTADIVGKMMPLFQQRNLTVHDEAMQNFEIIADEARISQVITNLLSNAQKYCAENGDIYLRVDQIQKNAYFYVSNTAQHFSAEALNKVWDAFYRADESRSSDGVGLGLSLVKSIISLHGGNCFVRNVTMENGANGVEFGFILPME